MNTQNTLFLGSSNDFGGSSILNKNITHITGIGQSKNETLYDYSNGKKFFDSSVVNNINAGMTMTSLAQGGENLLTNMSNDNTCGDVFKGNILNDRENEEAYMKNLEKQKSIIIENKGILNGGSKNELENNGNLQLHKNTGDANSNNNVNNFNLKNNNNNNIDNTSSLTQQPNHSNNNHNSSLANAVLGINLSRRRSFLCKKSDNASPSETPNNPTPAKPSQPEQSQQLYINSPPNFISFPSKDFCEHTSVPSVQKPTNVMSKPIYNNKYHINNFSSDPFHIPYQSRRSNQQNSSNKHKPPLNPSLIHLDNSPSSSPFNTTPPK